MKRSEYILDKPIKKIWNLQQLKIGDTLTGIPKAKHWINKKGNDFIKLSLDYGHARCQIFFLIFDFPKQKILNKKFYNSFELVRFYREANNIPVDNHITQLHDINWSDIIDWLNNLRTMKIRVVSQNMNGFKNIEIENCTDYSLIERVGFQEWIL